MNRELVLMVSHNGDSFYGWKPFHYEGERRVVHRTWCYEGKPESCAFCSRWYVMVYIPFALFEGIAEQYPVKGTVWRGNIYRIDYDGAEVSRYAFVPECGIEFHDFEKFDEIVFG